jgi:hypothetical protein
MVNHWAIISHADKQGVLSDAQRFAGMPMVSMNQAIVVERIQSEAVEAYQF